MDGRKDTAVEAVLEHLIKHGPSDIATVFGRAFELAMQIERERFLRAGSYERTAERRGYANGYKSKRIDTPAGTVTVDVPKTAGHDGEPFYPQSLERGRRSVRAVMLAVAEMYIKGVSTREVEAVMREFGIESLSSMQVSRAAKLLDDELEAWRTRPLGEIRYLILDARYEKMRHGGIVRDAAVLSAIGIGPDERRRVLGVSVALSEAEVDWRAFHERPTMRFVPVKSEERQGAAMVFRIRELLIRQRTQPINALRGHLTEFGQIVPQGAANTPRLIANVEDPDNGLPADAISTLKVLIAALAHLEAEIGKLDAEIARRAKENEVARRLMTVPGMGPLIATAIAVLAPPPETFRKARDFAAWLGLTPRQHSTGGKQRLGTTTKMGERSLRRLLIIGANSVIIKRHVHAAARPGTWLGGMLTRKPPMLVRVALANRMARIVWVLMARGGVYQSTAAAA